MEPFQEAKLPDIRIALRIFSAKVGRPFCLMLSSWCACGYPFCGHLSFQQYLVKSQIVTEYNALLHCGAKGGRNTVVDVSVGGSLLRGACDRSVYAMLKQDKLGISTALCRMVKLWAKRRRLTNTLKGGLSSFSFVLLTIFFLQQGGEANAAGQAHSLPPQSLSATGYSSHRYDLARLLLAFFNWAAEDLPRLQSFTLSVSSAKAERRAGPFKPLILAVPFAPGENAARCLRADVWEMLIRRELQRASRFMKQVVSQSGPDRRDAWLSGRIQHSVRTRQSPMSDASMPEVVAPVDRWLGLRTLLNPQ
eukprot:s2843_g6.t2